MDRRHDLDGQYYYAGSQRVAMRKGNPGTVYYLLGNHLGEVRP
ncbi:MAG: hypothetical protein WHX52_23155 [Anaerolineae bacterium]